MYLFVMNKRLIVYILGWVLIIEGAAMQIATVTSFIYGEHEGLYFLFTGIYPHPDDTLFYCANLWVLENLGLQISKIRILHLDAGYVRGKQLDVDRLFVISDSFYNGTILP